MQQARINDMEAQQAANEQMWNAAGHVQEVVKDNGWAAWLVVPPPYTGFSFRTFFEYDGPSLMDGVHQEHNIVDNLSDVWSEFSQVEELADNFINGVPSAQFAFVRAGGQSVSFLITADIELLRWIGSMLKRIYTMKLPPAVHPEGAYLPLNPFTFLQQQLNGFATALMDLIAPEADVVGLSFSSYLDCIIIDIGCSDTVEVSVSFDTSSAEEQKMQGFCSVADQISSLLSNEHAHVDTVLLRRSARSNKYDGFKVPPMSDKKPVQSKVKPHKVPQVQCSSSATVPCASDKNDKVHSEIPPPTPIATIQSIGTNMCGLRPNQLSKQKLLASLAAQERDDLKADA